MWAIKFSTGSVSLGWDFLRVRVAFASYVTLGIERVPIWGEVKPMALTPPNPMHFSTHGGRLKMQIQKLGEGACAPLSPS